MPEEEEEKEEEEKEQEEEEERKRGGGQGLPYFCACIFRFGFGIHYGPEQKKNSHLNIHLPTSLGVSEGARKQTSERSEVSSAEQVNK